jgi:hypothetical protein
MKNSERKQTTHNDHDKENLNQQQQQTHIFKTNDFRNVCLPDTHQPNKN